MLSVHTRLNESVCTSLYDVGTYRERGKLRKVFLDSIKDKIKREGGYFVERSKR